MDQGSEAPSDSSVSGVDVSKSSPPGCCSRTLLGALLIIAGLLMAAGDLLLRTVDDGPSSRSDGRSDLRYTNRDLSNLVSKYDDVFLGTVIGFNEAHYNGLLYLLSPHRDPLGGQWRDEYSSVVFAVDTAWRGVDAKEIELPLRFFQLGLQSDIQYECRSVPLNKGQRYLIYSDSPETTGRHFRFTNFCNPSAPIPADVALPINGIVDMPDGVPDLDTSVIGPGYVPTQEAHLLAFNLPIVWSIILGLIIGGTYLVKGPKPTNKGSVT